MKNTAIYLDYNATTPLDPAVLDTMLPFLGEAFGNPSSSSHSFGWQASAAVEKARRQVANTLNAQPQEIYWTSGATESNNLAILGSALAHLKQSTQQAPHILTASSEHKAVLEVCEQAQSLGAELSILPVNRYGQVEPDEIRRNIRPNTKLISVMFANNEIGSINPIREIGQICKEFGIWFHTDAAQAAGKVPIDVDALGVDLLSISGHKIYGPKGVGVLYVRNQNPKVELHPLFFGGSQEKGLRPGTLNVPGIVGLGQALELASELMESEELRLRDYAQCLIQTIHSEAPEVILNGHPTERLAGNISLSFPDLRSDIFSMGLSGLALSSSSACTSENATPSHVLKAIGHSDVLARSTLRIGLGRPTQKEDVDFAAQKLLGLVRKNKDLSIP